MYDLVMENKKWSNFDIGWFTFQLVALLLINIAIITTYDSIAIALISTVATLFGAAGNWLAVKKYNSNYLFAIIHIILYGYIAFITMVYGDFMLYMFIFLPLDIWGWIEWTRQDKKIKCDCENFEHCNCVGVKKVNKLTPIQIIISVIVIIVSTLLYGLFLRYLSDPAPLLDSASTVISIFGMWLMIKYYREQWWIWLLVNIVSALIWIQVILVTGDMIAIPFIAMWTIYIINSIFGIRRWNEN